MKKNIKDLYLDFFKSKGHVEIKSAPVIPENDPSTMFNTAGMQPLVPYLMGKVHPKGKRLTDVQKCLRTTDLDSIGDNTHHTFFEMLGNWSLGDYFKKESINYSFEFLTKVLEIPVNKLAVTVFEGVDNIPADEESKEIWLSLGIPNDRIATLGVADNFWIAGESGPCGPDTEIFYWTGKDDAPKVYDPSDERWVEIWNNVFMQYYKNTDGTITELSQKNVDTGMGVERVTSLLEGTGDNYQTSIFKPVIKLIENYSGKEYSNPKYQKSMRIIADHIRSIVIVSGDDAKLYPSNTDRGYILRRLIRRMIRHAKSIGIDINSNFDEEIANQFINDYKVYYSELEKNKDHIIEVLNIEKKKFGRTLEKGLHEFSKLTNNKEHLDGVSAFKLYDTYGFPIELTVELANENNITVDTEGFKDKFREHQEKSRANNKDKFKGGLAGNTEKTTKYHTATHLLNSAIKKHVNSNSCQLGSNITEDRLRFDFPSDHKLTDEEKEKIENQVNEWIKESIPVTSEEVNKEEAVKMGAEAQFIDRYDNVVTVYKIGDVSLEICGGPHVKNTGELGKFKIKKEESSSSGVRRIKAVLIDE